MASFLNQLRILSMEDLSLKIDYEFFIYILEETIFDYHQKFNAKQEVAFIMKILLVFCNFEFIL